MATAEIIGDVSTAVTFAAIPLSENAIQGSTRSFGLPAHSQQFPAPLVFGPPTGLGETALYWGNLFGGTIRASYTFVTTGYESSRVGSAASVSPVAWERLGLELMRIASLEPDWDGEGAESVPQKAVTAAAVLLALAKKTAEQSTIAQCSVPIISPAIEGGVTLKWIHGSKELKCTLLGDTVEVVRWRSPDRYESDGFWEIPVPRVAEHFEWLLQ